MPSDNIVTVAAAGSGKSTSIISEALSSPEKRILITTFTIEGTEELKKILFEKYKAIPKNIEVMSWMSFILQECIRPYQLEAFGRQVTKLIFVQGRSTQGIPKSRPAYYFGSIDSIYSDKLSEYAMLCNEVTSGKVIDRIASVFDQIFIDEFQDFAGYDFDLVVALLKSRVSVRIVTDPRQGTYSTNESAKNAQYKKSGVQKFVEMLESKGLCQILLNNWSYRCNQSICDLSDSLYPDFINTESRNGTVTGHDGVFRVRSSDIDRYLEAHHPVVLRYDKRTLWRDEKVRNFGSVKGRTYDRVLILENGPIKDFLSGKAFSSPAKYYVGLTRAKYSVAILHDGPISLNGINEWN
jgi:DNA helicase-2/ATP-dependent DNA helicase PcrA